MGISDIGSIFGDYIGNKFPYSLQTTSKYLLALNQ